MYGYRFLYQMADFGECMYLHRTMPNFEAIMKQYNQVETIPQWHNAQKPYMMHPKWNESYTGEGVVIGH
jgi:hypothetical protein